MLKWASYILALLGLSVAIYTVATASHEAPKIPLVGEPSVNPFARGIAATGIVEASSRNVSVSAPEGAQVTRVFVDVGQQVKLGDPLFELDPRALQSELLKAKAARDVADANLRQTLAQPRPETLPPLEAAVQTAQSQVDDWQDQYDRFKEAMRQTGAGDMELMRRGYALATAKNQLAKSRAELELAKAGAWGPDVEVSRAELASAASSVQAVQILLDRRTVRAPIDGTILKRNIEPGQFAPAEPRTAAISLGDLTRLHVRAQVDEEDLPELRPSAKAIARIRGSRDITVPLTMLRIEPLAEPKVSLSGGTTERVDTRVLEVVFIVNEKGDAPLYPGQLVDVFIDGGAPDVVAPKTGTAP